MAVLVAFKPGATGEAPATLATGEALLLRVCAQVSQESGLLREALGTLRALEGALARVHVLVHGQVGQAREALVAVCTLEGFLACVRAPVLHQRGQATEPFVALCALERLLTRVRAPVLQQRGQAAEALLALGTGIRLLACVRAVMRCERGLVHEAFAALSTRVGARGRGCASRAGEGGGWWCQSLGPLLRALASSWVKCPGILQGDVLAILFCASCGRCPWALPAQREIGPPSLRGDEMIGGIPQERLVPTGALCDGLLAVSPIGCPGRLGSLHVLLFADQAVLCWEGTQGTLPEVASTMDSNAVSPKLKLLP